MPHAFTRRLILLAAAGVAIAAAGARARAQAHAHAAEVHGTVIAGRPPADVAALHMEMSPRSAGNREDSLKAAAVATTLRAALVKYVDTTAAVKDGYVMFAPQLKNQKVYHFTSKWRAVQESYRFDPAKPTSLLYTKGADGRFALVGAMYTAPKRFGPDKLDARVPLSIARWHKHIDWCIPPRGERQRWLERRDGMPLFGPESPIVTKAACDAVNGDFHESVFGWMVHANVMAGNDPATIWGDEHAGHDMHEGMKMDADHVMP
jgi:hypothetical protein